MVAARRCFEGCLRLSSLSRLRDVLCEDSAGLDDEDVHFAIQFDRDALQVPYVELRIDAQLPLLCQRSLQRFLYPVHVVQRLGLLQGGSGQEEVDEAGLPPDYESLLVPDDGMLRPADLVEDELILAVPVVPMMPGTEALQQDWQATGDDEVPANPFAALSALKKN